MDKSNPHQVHEFAFAIVPKITNQEEAAASAGKVLYKKLIILVDIKYIDVLLHVRSNILYLCIISAYHTAKIMA